jgi:hypothetical protein
MMSGLDWCARFVVVPVEALLSLSTLGLYDLDRAVGPFGKVRSSTKPVSRLLGNIDSYWGFGRVLALAMAGLWSSGICVDWVEVADMADSGDSAEENVRPVPFEGSGEDSDVDAPPAFVSPKGWRTSRSLRKYSFGAKRESSK